MHIYFQLSPIVSALDYRGFWIKPNILTSIKKQLHMPVYREAYPNEKQLERHFDQFMAETEILR